jgi:hypothetical protein
MPFLVGSISIFNGNIIAKNKEQNQSLIIIFLAYLAFIK